VIDALRVHPPRSALQEGCGGGLGDADFGRRLGGKREAQTLQQELKFRLWLSVASEQKLSAVGGRDAHIDHLHGGKFLAHYRASSAAHRALLGDPIAALSEHVEFIVLRE
jgi:hypothetical protein